eukprot:7794821-Ditylum_brightwellii.AAC.1
MKNVRPAFEIMKDGKVVLIRYQKVHYRMIFNVKMEDFWRKARLVVGGHMTDPLATIAYASAVSHMRL